MTKNIIVTASVALVVSLVVGFYFVGSQQSNIDLGGLSERNIIATSLKVGTPTTKFNVNNSGTKLAVGTTTPSTLGDIVADGTGTTTLMLGSSTAGRGTCLQVENVTGNVVRIVVTGTTISAALGTCK